MSDQFVPGLAGVPAAKSAIGLIDGQQGILRYRGIRIEALAEQSTFEEVTYLLLFGKLPTSDELASFTAELAGMRSLPAEVVSVLKALPKETHPMLALQAGISTLGGVYSDSNISGRTTGPEDGNAPWFSDNNDNAGSAAGANFDIGNGTITFWVNPGADRWDRVIAMKAGYFSQGNGDVVFLIDDDRIAVYHEISGPDSYLVGDNLPENTWSFVTYSFGQSGAKLRVNVNSPSTNGSFKGGLEYTFDDIFRFGGPAGYDYAGVDEELDGSVLGFAVFDRILTTPELRYIYEIDEIPLTIDPDSTRWIVD